MNIVITKCEIYDSEDVGVASVTAFDESTVEIKIDQVNTLESWRELSAKIEEAIVMMDFK